MAEPGLRHQPEHGHAGDGGQKRNASGHAVRQVERRDDEGVRTAAEASEERLEREPRLARPLEQSLEDGQQRAAFPHPARASRRRASTKWGLSSILPSSVSTPEPGLLSKASTTRLAQSTSCADGVKTSWMIATWSGWIAILPP